MIPSEVREGLKANLKNISDLRIYDIMPDVVVPPSAIIGQLDFTFDLNNSRGLDQSNVDIFVIVQRFSERSGIQNLDKYLSGSGDQSIKQAIESDRTLGGACNTLRVTSAESGTFTSGDVDFLSYRYRVTIWGQGE
jgi:hypothetical protein